MDKNLPRVYASPINKPITNNREYYVSTARNKEVRSLKTENVPKKINEIFQNPHHVYKSKVRIIINNEVLETTIVGKTANDLLTINGEKIAINKIDSIERL